MNVFTAFLQGGDAIRAFDGMYNVHYKPQDSFLVIAATAGDLDRVQALYDRGLRELDMAIRGAASGGFLDIVYYLHQCGAGELDLALHSAARNGHLTVVSYPANAGANLTGTLSWAAARGDQAMLNYAIAEGALNDIDHAIELARRNGNKVIETQLVNLKANI